MIKFWKTRDPYGCFSNFSKHSIIVDDKIYPTTEHFYQSKKFLDPESQEKIRLLKTARESKDIASAMQGLRPDWEEVKYGIMMDALRYKVQQHEEIKQELLNTGDEEIGEDSPYDFVWGIGADGTGKNLLGKAWMEVREELRRAAKVAECFSVLEDKQSRFPQEPS